MARPILIDLAGASGEAAGLALPDGDLVHYIDQVDTPNRCSVRDWTGARVPLHAVSSGQVLLAFRTPAAIERYLGRPLERFTRPARWPIRRPCASGCATVRRRGLRVGDRGVRSEGSRRSRRRSRTASGEVIAAVHVHGPSYRFPTAGTEGDLAQRVVAGAARIAAGLRET